MTEPRITQLPGGGRIEQYPDGRVAHITPRSQNDCQAMAVSVAYGFNYRTLPARGWDFAPRGTPEREAQNDEFHRVWGEWAAAQGLQWWHSEEWAPAFLPRWIATVFCEGDVHAVAMSYGDLLHDPDINNPLRHVGPHNVHGASVLLPAEQSTLRGRGWWRITRPASQTRLVPLRNPT